MSEVEKLWEKFSYILSKHGLNPADYKEVFDKSLFELELLSEEEKDAYVIDLAFGVVREAGAPPLRSLVETRSEVRVEKLTSADKSSIFTYGLGWFVVNSARKYGISFYEVPELANSFINYVIARLEVFEARFIDELYAKKYLTKVLLTALTQGIRRAISPHWTDLLSELNKEVAKCGMSSYEDIRIRRISDGKVVEEGVGMLWIYSVVYRMYKIIGVDDVDVPRSFVLSSKVIEKWIKLGCPRSLTYRVVGEGVEVVDYSDS